MLEAQNRRIDDLLERIRLQQEKLDKQNVRIRALQSQVRKRFRNACYHYNYYYYENYLFVFPTISPFISELLQVQQSRQSSNNDGALEQRDSPVGK